MLDKHLAHFARIITLTIAVLNLVACNVLENGMPTALSGSGEIVSRTYDFADFDQVSVSAAFRGTIEQGSDYSIVVRVDENLEQHLKVEQIGNQVKIDLMPNTLVNRGTLEFSIVMPTITDVEASGASVIELSGFSSSESLRAEASGASRIEGDISSGDADIESSGSSTIRFSGTAGDLQANASGASTIDLEQFMVDDAKVNASGASRIVIQASGTLDAEASGASTVNYLGNPDLGQIEQSGGSTISAQ
jgi:hypothetical protein